VGTIGMISKIKTGGVASIFHENITVTYSFSLTHLNPCIDNLLVSIRAERCTRRKSLFPLRIEPHGPDRHRGGELAHPAP
jgi:hypothetical protein